MKSLIYKYFKNLISNNQTLDVIEILQVVHKSSITRLDLWIHFTSFFGKLIKINVYAFFQNKQYLFFEIKNISILKWLSSPLKLEFKKILSYWPSSTQNKPLCQLSALYLKMFGLGSDVWVSNIRILYTVLFR